MNTERLKANLEKFIATAREARAKEKQYREQAEAMEDGAAGIQLLLEEIDKYKDSTPPTTVA